MSCLNPSEIKYDEMSNGDNIKLVPLSGGGKIWVIQTTEENCNIYKRNDKLFVEQQNEGGTGKTQIYKYDKTRLTSVAESDGADSVTSEKKSGIYCIDVDGGGETAVKGAALSATPSVMSQKQGGFLFALCNDGGPTRKHACKVIRVGLWMAVILAAFCTVIYFFGMDHDQHPPSDITAVEPPAKLD